MKTIVIFTSEVDNFVPVELAKAAKEKGVEGVILDITKLVVLDSAEGSVIGVWDDEGKKLSPVPNGADVMYIPRLSEHHTSIKLNILRKLSSSGSSLLNSIGGLEACNDKLQTQVMLTSAKVKTPKTILINPADPLPEIIEHLEGENQLVYPAIIKTMRGTHGIGVMKVDSRASLVSVAQTLQKFGHEFLIQEFIAHERSARIITIGDKVLAANLRGQPAETGEFRTNSHLGSETTPYTPPEDEVALAIGCASLLGCAFTAVDYIIRELPDASKELIVLEVNGSPGLEAIQKNWPDRNLAGDVIEFALSMFPKESQPDVVPTNVPAIDLPAPEVVTVANVPADVPASTQTADNAIGLFAEVEISKHMLFNETIMSRIDTGAKYCALHVNDMEIANESVTFTRNDRRFTIPLEKTVKIRNVFGVERRPIITMMINLAGRSGEVNFTLTSRADMKCEALIGSLALASLGLVVDPSLPEPDGKVASPEDAKYSETVEDDGQQQTP